MLLKQREHVSSILGGIRTLRRKLRDGYHSQKGEQNVLWCVNGGGPREYYTFIQSTF